MKNVELIRSHVVNYLVRLRSYISMLPESTETVDRLRGEEGEKRAARITGVILDELGHDGTQFIRQGEPTPTEQAGSVLRRAVKKAAGGLRGE